MSDLHHILTQDGSQPIAQLSSNIIQIQIESTDFFPIFLTIFFLQKVTAQKNKNKR